MKLSRIANPLFQQTLNRLASQPLPLKVAFKLKGITAKVKEEFTKFEELRKQSLTTHGKKGEDGKLLLQEKSDNVQFDDEGLKAFMKDMDELGDTEVEVATLKLSELGDKVELSADELLSADDILVEG